MTDYVSITDIHGYSPGRVALSFVASAAKFAALLHLREREGWRVVSATIEISAVDVENEIVQFEQRATLERDDDMDDAEIEFTAEGGIKPRVK